jgi:hypothetical protein
LTCRRRFSLGHQPLTRRSAGLIPFRWENGKPEFLLIYNLFFEQWQFPRGGAHRDENDLDLRAPRVHRGGRIAGEQTSRRCRSELHYTVTFVATKSRAPSSTTWQKSGRARSSSATRNHCEARWASPQEAWELLTETSPEQLPALDAALEFLNHPRV